MANMKPELEKDLEEFRTAVNTRLMQVRVLKFGTLGDMQFEDKSSLGRGRVPGVRDDTQYPKLDTIYLWLRACESTVQDIFGVDSPTLARENLPLHERLEFLIKKLGDKHWLVGAINEAYGIHFPKPHGKIKKTKETAIAATSDPKKSKPTAKKAGAGRAS